MATIETIESTNKKFWLDMTKEGTELYCTEMLRLSQEYCDRTPIVEIIDNHSKVVELKFEEKAHSRMIQAIRDYMDYIVNLTDKGLRDAADPSKSPFPKDLHGYIHEYSGEGKFQPNHLMCKLGALRDEKNRMTYEFLIEYDIFETDVEIYYGVKAVSDYWESTDEFKSIVLSHWNTVRSLNKYPSLAKKFKITNNGNNGTFWPFWIRLNINCKENLKDTIFNLRKFYKGYKSALNLDPINSFQGKLNAVIANLHKWDELTDNYTLLTNAIRRNFNQKCVEVFDRIFIPQCLGHGFIKEVADHRYEITNMPKYRFVFLVRSFFTVISSHYVTIKEIQLEEKTRFVPQKELTKVFFGKGLKEITTSDWNTSESRYEVDMKEYKKMVQNWLGIQVSK